MRKILIITIIFITISYVSSCSKENEKASEGSFTVEKYIPEPGPPVLSPGDFEELKFTPPEIGEKIVVEADYRYDPKKNRFLIYKESEDNKELLFTIMPETNFYDNRISKDNIYFTMEDSDIYNDPQHDLWKIDIKKGLIINTKIRIGREFELSEDGNYLCYLYSDFKHFKELYNEKLVYDIVKIFEFDTGETYVFDFFNSYPETRGAGGDINFSLDRFDIDYIGDGAGVYLKGYILISDKKFYQTK